MQIELRLYGKKNEEKRPSAQRNRALKFSNIGRKYQS